MINLLWKERIIVERKLVCAFSVLYNLRFPDGLAFCSGYVLPFEDQFLEQDFKVRLRWSDFFTSRSITVDEIAQIFGENSLLERKSWYSRPSKKKRSVPEYLVCVPFDIERLQILANKIKMPIEVWRNTNFIKPPKYVFLGMIFP
ncbi:hypothetical protein A2382_00150 [Candidatus Woesebacteria bacterium RIFOXYB1_FULL_38_16]|uniref:Uncharacterized protein n=1 Tax=Candidatus Woesebacteria bacterium RIFOXYB1_FULL_38_16 TaxID=1802538 RepID=A0A1F8CV15_9BACT|nr:MAG: hypothetical protein A2191_00820 [Candidatus Woesebacteria bacterium RIFOXYA1_FULL_38_9]OGM80183.1 MAG: hypothetical protein A2382_00150 [Candidatus Woesebacteria bacterium RIFOXYB1_FULL_38_16]